MSQLPPVRLAAALLLAVACATPAFAQADFSGHWAPLFHEDRPERLPGPELGDYLGIPLSEAGRRARTATTATASPWCRNTSVARTQAIT